MSEQCDHAPTISQLRCPCGQFTVAATVAWPQQIIDLECQLAEARRLLERLLELRDVTYEMVVEEATRAEAAKRDYSKSTRERDQQQGIADTARAVRVYLEDEGDVHSVAEARAAIKEES